MITYYTIWVYRTILMSEHRNTTDRRTPIQEPPGHPVIGHTIPYLRDPFGFLTESARRGRIVRLNFLGHTVYQLNQPADIEQVLVHENQRFIKGELIQQVLGSINDQGLLVTEGEKWQRLRTRINPAFHPDRIAEYVPTMTRMTERLVDQWNDGEHRDIHSDMMELTLEIVAHALFGIDIRRQATEISDALEIIMQRSENAFVDIVPRWLPTPSNRRFQEAVSRVEAIVATIIEERGQNPGNDVVSALLASENDKAQLSKDEISDQVMTLLLAGHETTALALTFTLYLLAQYPAVERQLRSEVETVLDGKSSTMADLSRLVYTEQVVKEAMRVYPPVHTILRETAEPVELAGYRVPEGTTLSMHQWTIHRDPEFYPNPYAFDPDRWTDAFEEELPRFAYFPFGGGPRRCIGDRFAMIEAQIILATLIQHVHLELRSAASLEFEWTITTRPKSPIEMRIEKH